jgi:hypothetical protein
VYQKDGKTRHHLDFTTISAINRQGQGRMNPKTPSETSPHPIGEILDSVLPPIHGNTAKNRKGASKSNKSMAAEDRIVKLEQKIRFLDRQIKKIARTLNVGPASK